MLFFRALVLFGVLFVWVPLSCIMMSIVRFGVLRRKLYRCPLVACYLRHSVVVRYCSTFIIAPIVEFSLYPYWLFLVIMCRIFASLLLLDLAIFCILSVIGLWAYSCRSFPSPLFSYIRTTAPFSHFFLVAVVRFLCC